MEIIPAVLPKSREDLEEKLAQLAAIPAVTTVHIDAVDGRFTAPACWPYRSGDTIPAHLGDSQRFRYEIDLMTLHPLAEVHRWLAAGATRFALHAESVTDLHGAIVQFGDMLGYEKGFAIGIETPLSLITPYLAQVEYVQLMGIANIGKQSQPFDKRVVEKVRALRRLDASITIQVDGGVTLETAPSLVAAGVSRLIVGHALWQAPDLAAEIQKFNTLSVVE